jgi:hypothetical protein
LLLGGVLLGVSKCLGLGHGRLGRGLLLLLLRGEAELREVVWGLVVVERGMFWGGGWGMEG